MSQNERKLIAEEQEKLDRLIDDMAQALANLEKQKTRASSTFQAAKEKGNPEAYGELVKAGKELETAKAGIQTFYQSRDSLYSQRMLLDFMNEAEQGQEELFIGLHDYSYDSFGYSRKFITSWLNNICRPFIMDPTKRTHECLVKEKYGSEYRTQYDLKLHRDVEVYWDSVEHVTERYSDYTSAEEAIYDSFLKTLLSRRTEQEFKNIVFSIQKRQGEIIQAPYDQNIIVQGCAGSGKTMIMFHRLPVILFDNPDSLDRAGIYIITPSEAYNQMVDQLRDDLEIQDLQMGTLNDYYLSVINKYRQYPLPYKKINPDFKLGAKQEAYIYSSECVDDITYYILKAMNSVKDDYPELSKYLEMTVQKHPWPSRQLRSQTLQLQNILAKGNKTIRNYHQKVTDFSKILSSMQNDLMHRRENTVNELKQKRNELNQQYHDLIVEIKIRPASSLSREDYDKRREKRKSLKDSIANTDQLISAAQRDIDYYKKLNQFAAQIPPILNSIRIEVSSQDYNQTYSVLQKQSEWSFSFTQLASLIEQVGYKYSSKNNSLRHLIKEAKVTLNNIYSTQQACLPYRDYSLLNDALKANMQIEEILEQYVYWNIISKIDQDDRLYKDKAGIACSPYLFLQILFQCHGAPNAATEKILMIDEAQNLTIEEFNLLHSVNKNKVIFNLFGDIHQHIEDSKGIDSWEELKSITSFSSYELYENYRNARQITKYCNDQLESEMLAINFDGAGVHEIEADNLYDTFADLLMDTQRAGLHSIIVKDHLHQRILSKMLEDQSSYIQIIAGYENELHPFKWNLLTVPQARGLEFNTAIVITDRMSTNEKYISYTRALDELYVYDGELPELDFSIEEAPLIQDFHEEKPDLSRRKKRNISLSTETESALTDSDQTESQAETMPLTVAQFFEAAGLEVLDNRYKNGMLWVIGKRKEIADTVNQAIKLYNIGGVFGKGKASGYREGWFTRTKK